MAIQNFSGRFITIGYRFHPFEGEVSFSSFFPKLGISSFCCNLESAESHPFVVVCTMFMFFFSVLVLVLGDQKKSSKQAMLNQHASLDFMEKLTPAL